MEKASYAKRCRIFALGALSVLILLAILVALAKNGIGLSCLFYQITGLQCPGCGNSRAVLSLLRLDFAAALSYNLLFPLEFAYLLWVLLRCCYSYLREGRFRYRPLHITLDIGVLAAVLIWWVLRNLI